MLSLALADMAAHIATLAERLGRASVSGEAWADYRAFSEAEEAREHVSSLGLEICRLCDQHEITGMLVPHDAGGAVVAWCQGGPDATELRDLIVKWCAEHGAVATRRDWVEC